MKKLRIFLTAILLLFVLAFTGCQGKEAEPSIDDKAIFEEELSPLTEEELAKLEETIDFDEEMTPVDEADLDNLDIEPVDENEQDSGEEPAEKEPSDQEVSDVSGSENGSSENSSSKVKEDGTYTSKDEVAVYLHTYGHLPSNFITKKEALDLGWVSKEGNLDEVAPGKSIGGDKFGNYEKMLPEEKGRRYFECDIDFEGDFRNGKRIIYSNDGLIFYTEDHYETFEQLY